MRADCGVLCTARGNLMLKGLNGNFCALMLLHCFHCCTVKASLEQRTLRFEWQKANQGLLSVSKQIRLIVGLSFVFTCEVGRVKVGRRKSVAPPHTRACFCNATKCSEECGIGRIVAIPNGDIRTLCGRQRRHAE